MFTIATNKPNSEKKIILALIVFLFSSFGFLFYFEKRQLDSADASWEVYFENPKSADLTFTIKNSGKTKRLYWQELLANNTTKQKEAELTIPAGQESTISLSGKNAPEKSRVTIEVSDEFGEKKEIYKIPNQD